MNDTQRVDLLTRPGPALLQDIQKIDSDILIVGGGGKMGPTVALLAMRAMREAGLGRKVRVASIFNERGEVELLQQSGVEVIECDLFDELQVKALPECGNIIYMVGRKFNTTSTEHLTWATNVLLPTSIVRRFAHSSIVAFSTGNIYGYSSVCRGGSTENDALHPVGEYAVTSLGRERLLEHMSRTNGTPMAMLRLNYAVDLRYGVLNDIAQKVYLGQPIDISAGVFNCIWQGDVASYTLRALLHCAVPPSVFNLTGPETVSVAWAARTFGRLMHKEVILQGEEGRLALHSNACELMRLMGYPGVTLGQMMQWTAQWIMDGGATIDAPTHFEVTDGKY